MIICEMCGEEIDDSLCPFCGTENDLGSYRGSKKMISVNIKKDMPTVEVALKRVDEVLESANRIKAVKVVHGYGSSGRGGVIREELRNRLSGKRARNEIKDFIPGEEFSGAFNETLVLLKQFPFLESDDDFNGRNQGVTIIIL